MVRNNLYILLCTALLLLSGCQHNEPNDHTTGTLFTLSVTEGEGLRGIVPNDEHSQLLFTWDKARPDLQLYFKQDGKFYKGALLAPLRFEPKPGTILDDYTKPVFAFRVPRQIDISKSFTLYGVVAEQSMIKDNKLYVGVHPHPTHELKQLSHNRLTTAPAYFKIDNVSENNKKLTANMQHLGCMVIFYLKNSTGQKLALNGLALQGKDNNNAFYHTATGDPLAEKGEAPFIDVENPEQEPIKQEITMPLPQIEIPAGEVSIMGFWARPKSNADSMGAQKIVTKQIGTTGISTTVNMPELNRTGNAPKVGSAYHIYLDWKSENKVERIEQRPTNNQVTRR